MASQTAGRANAKTNRLCWPLKIYERVTFFLGDNPIRLSPKAIVISQYQTVGLHRTHIICVSILFVKCGGIKTSNLKFGLLALTTWGWGW